MTAAPATEPWNESVVISRWVDAHLGDLEKKLRAEVDAPERLLLALQIVARRAKPVRSDPLQQPAVFFVPGLTAKPWHAATEFPWTQRAPEYFADIARELEGVSSGRYVPYAQSNGSVYTGNWELFRFYNEKGEKLDDNCQLCPRTVEVVNSIPRLNKSMSMVAFSSLAPSTHIDAHFGVTNARLRCHLAITGAAGCSMSVGEQNREWVEGEWSVFDDSYVHEVWHRGDRSRIILMVDIWHPDLSEQEIRFVTAFQGAMKSHLVAATQKT